MSFLARYRGATLRAYTQDLRYFLRWCTERGVEPLLVERPHLELYPRQRFRLLKPRSTTLRFL